MHSLHVRTGLSGIALPANERSIEDQLSLCQSYAHREGLHVVSTYEDRARSGGTGSSAVASAAYRAASRLHDERLDRSHDFSGKRGVVHSEVMLPENAPEAWSDRERLWNDVEAFEVRKDAQLAREVEFAIPREMTQAQGIELARDFVRAEFVGLGMIADLNVHWDMAEDGSPKPHAHVMLTMRAVDENGFGQKVRAK
jgi:MobA/MobL family